MYYPIVEQVARKVKNEPDPEFHELSKLGAQAANRGYFTKYEFLEICAWKSERRAALCKSNSEEEVQRFTSQALAAAEESERIRALINLAGVAVPTASALLAAYSPAAFGVIDIRAWQFLHTAGAVHLNRAGLNLSIRNWLEYLKILRAVAKRVGTTPRLVEISLYWEHKGMQQSALYAVRHSSSAFNPGCQRRVAPRRKCPTS